MMLSPRLRKISLTAHVAASVGWLGAVLVFLAHAIVSVTGDNAFNARAAALAMGITAWFVVLPLSIASVATGLVQALGTAWGLLRHYWIVAKLFLTGIATGVLLLKMAPISALASTAAAGPLPSDEGLRMSLLVHAAGGVVILLAILTLAIFRPAGRTWLGRRSDEVEPLPHWVKVSLLVLLSMVVALGMMFLFGEHGPSSHLR